MNEKRKNCVNILKKFSILVEFPALLMNFQLTFSVQFSQFNEAQVGQISVKSLEHLAVSHYLSPDLTVPGSLAPGALCPHAELHSFV